MGQAGREGFVEEDKGKLILPPRLKIKSKQKQHHPYELVSHPPQRLANDALGLGMRRGVHMLALRLYDAFKQLLHFCYKPGIIDLHIRLNAGMRAM